MSRSVQSPDFVLATNEHYVEGSWSEIHGRTLGFPSPTAIPNPSRVRLVSLKQPHPNSPCLSGQ
jgi:hypothetical protein